MLSQPARAMGKVAAEKGHKTAVTLTWKYAAGEQSTGGFKETFEKGGGKVVKEMTLPFPNVEFQPFLTEIASLKPDAVYVFFAGAGAVKFVKDYAAAGLKEKIPLYGPGFLTDGTLEAQGDAAQGLLTTLHYADALDNPKLRVTIGDAREALLTGRDRYDVVASEPSNPFRAGIASLFTVEFYRAARERMTADGVFAQWVQGYEIDARTLRTM